MYLYIYSDGATTDDRATPPHQSGRAGRRMEEEENGGVFAEGFSDEGEDVIGDLESEVMRTATPHVRVRQ